MQKAYSRIDWDNYPSEKTPLNESNLNKMDAAIDELDNRIIEQDLKMQEPVTKSAASAAAAAESESAAQASEEACLGALEEVRKKTVKTAFSVDFATGHLLSNAPGYDFLVNKGNGHLEWGVR